MNFLPLPHGQGSFLPTFSPKWTGDPSGVTDIVFVFGLYAAFTITGFEGVAGVLSVECVTDCGDRCFWPDRGDWISCSLVLVCLASLFASIS